MIWYYYDYSFGIAINLGVTWEKEFFKLGKRGIRKKVDLIRKTEVEKELKVVEKNLGQLKNKLRLMRLEDK